MSEVKTKMEILDTLEVRVPLRKVLEAHVSEATREQCKGWRISVWEDDGKGVDHPTEDDGDLLIRFQRRRDFEEAPGQPGEFVQVPEKPRDECVTKSELEKILHERLGKTP